MAIDPAFQGHGIYTYLAEDTMRFYANYASASERGSVLDRIRNLARGGATAAPVSSDGLVRALKDMDMRHIWVRLFGLEGVMPEAPTRTLIDALRRAGFRVAGWGYCHGRNWRDELATAIRESRRYGLTAFIADIEPGRLLGGTKSKWRIDDFASFIDGLTSAFGSESVGISTWPVLKIQNDAEFPSVRLMETVADKIAMFAPQAYWMKYPANVHYSSTGFSESEFPRNDPASFVRLVTASWRRTGFDQPLVLTGQAYWGEGGPTQRELEAKLAQFSLRFSEWNSICGFNWWHAGGNLAMSKPMLEALKSAKLGHKPFAVPEDSPIA